MSPHDAKTSKWKHNDSQAQLAFSDLQLPMSSVPRDTTRTRACRHYKSSAVEPSAVQVHTLRQSADHAIRPYSNNRKCSSLRADNWKKPTQSIHQVLQSENIMSVQCGRMYGLQMHASTSYARSNHMISIHIRLNSTCRIEPIMGPLKLGNKSKCSIRGSRADCQTHPHVIQCKSQLLAHKCCDLSIPKHRRFTCLNCESRRMSGMNKPFINSFQCKVYVGRAAAENYLVSFDFEGRNSLSYLTDCTECYLYLYIWLPMKMPNHSLVFWIEITPLLQSFTV